MNELPEMARNLTAARDLVAYHVERDRFYWVASELLRAAPDPRVLEAASVALHRVSNSDEVRLALRDRRAAGAAREYAQLFEGPTPMIPLRCGDGAIAARDAAQLAAGLSGPATPTTELRALAILAQRTAHALRNGDMLDAAALSDLQSRFLEQHAASCIAALAAALVARGLPFYRALGRSLADQIAEDLRLLGPQGSA